MSLLTTKQQHLACLSLLLLILLILKTPQFALGYDRFNKFRAAAPPSSSSELSHHGKHQHKHNGFFTSSPSKENGDDIFGPDLRKVHTGPNPLHNR